MDSGLLLDLRGGLLFIKRLLCAWGTGDTMSKAGMAPFLMKLTVFVAVGVGTDTKINKEMVHNCKS